MRYRDFENNWTDPNKLNKVYSVEFTYTTDEFGNDLNTIRKGNYINFSINDCYEGDVYMEIQDTEPSVIQYGYEKYFKKYKIKVTDIVNITEVKEGDGDINENENELEFCLNCLKPNPPEREICNCGSRNFIYGNNFSLDNEKVTCGCGCNDFAIVLHVNSNPSRYVLKCTKCNNIIKKEYYRDNDSYIY